jgi:Rieske Fe-S protein
VYLRALTRRLVESGVRLHAGTHATTVHGDADAAVETKSGATVRCSHIVVATNTPINNRVAVHTKQAGYQTYVVALRVRAGVLPPLLLWDGLWEDDGAYHYVRLLAGSEPEAGADDLLIVGGEDHKTGQGPQGDEPYAALEAWTRRHFPMCGALERRWSGEVMEPADGLGYIGHNPVGARNVYVVTGDSGNGMTNGAISAMLVPDLIAGRENPWARLYDPARKVGIHALSDYARENVNTLAQYRDWFRHGDVTDEAEIRPGEGAIVAKGRKHLAVYKDEQGNCTRLVATCPHLGGIVRWNSQEKTWDCPCHASRFERLGKVLHGPANSDLKLED